MSIVTRRFSACPVRTASNTWQTIVNVITASSPEAAIELFKVEGIAASIISDETAKKSPITIIGAGSRLRIYCIYDADGSTDDANESALSWNPFEGNWEIHFPVEKDELDWIIKALKEKGARFKAYEVGTKPIDDNESDERSSPSIKELTIDISKL